MFKEIPFDVVKSSLTLFLAEVLNRTVVEEECNSPLYHFVRKSVLELDGTKNASDFHLHFLATLTQYLGFSPHGKYSDETPEFNLMDGSFEKSVTPFHPHYLAGENAQRFSDLFFNASSLKLNKKNRRELLLSLLEYYRLHVSNFNILKSLEVIEQVFA